MKKKNLLFAILCFVSFNLLSQASYEVTVKGHVINADGSFVNNVEVYFIPDDSTTVNQPKYISETDEEGFFVFVIETLAEIGCGVLKIANCSDVDHEVVEVCFSKDNYDIIIDIPYCQSVEPCVDEIIIDQYPLDDGTYSLVLALPEDKVYDVKWGNGETGFSIIAEENIEYCVTITSTDCISKRCVVVGQIDECKVKIFQEFNAGGTTVLYVESYGLEILEYQWSNGSSEPIIEVFDSGQYCLEAIMVNGCIAGDCIEFEPWIDDCWVFIFESLNDAGIPILAIQEIWGQRVKNYEWSTGKDTPTIVPDTTGTYEVTVTTESGCVFTAEYQYISPEDCQVEIIVEPSGEPGFGGAFLFADARPHYVNEFNWSTGDQEPVISIEENGEYCVTITNDSGCENYDCVIVDLDSIWAGHCHVYIEEFVDDKGDLGLKVLGWFPSTSHITWSTGDSSNIISPTEFGSYCVTVTNGNGCYAEACYDYFGGGECSLDMKEAEYEGIKYIYPHPNGVPPFNYTWSDGSTEDYLTILEEGEYCVTMMDATGCSTTWCGFIFLEHTEFCEAYIAIEQSTNGEIYYRVHAFGEGPFEYKWSDDRLEGEKVKIEEPGVYCVDVYDVLGCHTTTCVEVLKEEECVVSIDYTIGVSGDTILYVRFDTDSIYSILWDNGSTDLEINYDGNPVCVTVEFGSGCVGAACFDGIPETGAYHLTGMVSDPELDHLLDLDKITLFLLDTDSTLSEVMADIEIQQNVFIANVNQSGQYIVKADVDGYIPTYHQSAIHWQDAVPIGVDDATAAIVYEIIMVPEDVGSGEGKVTGSVLSGDNVRMNLGYRSGDPVEEAEIILTTLDGNPIQAVYTDTNGNFILEDLAVGTYYVVLEIAGFPQQKIEVTISENSLIVEGLVFEYPSGEADSTSGIQEYKEFSISLYPNPALDQLLVDLNTSFNENFRAVIMDLKGQVIYQKMIDLNGKTQFQLDIQSIPGNNLYLLVLQNGGNIASGKFYKSD